MASIQNKLERALVKELEYKKVAAAVEENSQRRATSVKKLNKLAAVLEKELKDFEKLQDLSLKGLFHKVLGNKEEQMEKEKQEYLAASLKYDEVKKELDLIDFEYKVLSEKLEKLKGIGEEVSALSKAREKELLKENSSEGRQLQGVHQKIVKHKHMLHEVAEALAAGEEAIKKLEIVLNYLGRARNWGQWDMMGQSGRGGSGYHRQLMKRTNIDRARAGIHHAQHALRVFDREIKDVYGPQASLQLNIDLGSFNAFADIFFDNLITDWIIQTKIRNAISGVQGARDRVLRMIRSLERERIERKAQLTELEKQRKALIRGRSKSSK